MQMIILPLASVSSQNDVGFRLKPPLSAHFNAGMHFAQITGMDRHHAVWQQLRQPSVRSACPDEVAGPCQVRVNGRVPSCNTAEQWTNAGLSFKAGDPPFASRYRNEIRRLWRGWATVGRSALQKTHGATGASFAFLKSTQHPCRRGCREGAVVIQRQAVSRL